MDGGAIQRAVPAANAAPVRSDLTAARPSAPVESPPDKVVPPVGEASAVVLDTSSTGKRVAETLAALDQQADILRQTRIEEKTRDVVTAWVNERTGEVVRQFPAEDVLRLRAYLRDWLNEKDEPATKA